MPPTVLARRFPLLCKRILRFLRGLLSAVSFLLRFCLGFLGVAGSLLDIRKRILDFGEAVVRGLQRLLGLVAKGLLLS